MYTSTLRTLVAVAAFGLCGLIAAAAPVPDRPTDEQLKERALKLNNLTDLGKMQEELTALLKDKDAAKRLVKIAAGMQKEAKEKEPPFKFNAALILAKVAHNLKDYEIAERFYEFCADNATKIRSGQKMLQAFEGLMDLYWDQKKFEQVDRIAQRFIEEKGEKIDFGTLLVMEKMAQAKAKQGDTDKALELAERLSSPPRIGTYFIQTKGWIYREAGKYKEAIEAYEEFADKLDDLKDIFGDDERTRMKKNTQYILTGLHVDNKDVKKAAGILEKLMKDDPENPTFYNDLGFIWCDHDMNLDESEKLIRKALELDEKQRQKLLEEGKISAEDAKRENAAYLDSLGWVLFKKKKYAEAEKYLRQASEDKEEGNHIEIWDHLADVLVALDRKKEAIEVWTRSLKFDDVSKRDVERRKRITEKLNKFRAELKDDK
jgi:tetratricopeptide (TPR) repeat protein